MKSGIPSAFLALAICAAALPAWATGTTPSPSPSASAAAVDAGDPAVATRAREWLHRLQTGDIDRSQLDAQMQSLFTPATAAAAAAQFRPLGDPTAFSYVTKQIVADDNTAYIYRVVFKSGIYNEVFVLDKAGKISGLQLPPAN